ncbi:MAG: hypothetical protein U0360_06100 [Dehalococcoidia bacterium]
MTTVGTPIDPILLDFYERIADSPNCILARTRSQTVPDPDPLPPR